MLTTSGVKYATKLMFFEPLDHILKQPHLSWMGMMVAPLRKWMGNVAEITERGATH